MKTIKNLKAEEIRKSILQLAIQGKLVKQDPNDEPAGELVKRIYAEKQKLIKEGKISKDKNESYIFKGDDNCYYEKIGNSEPVKLEDLPFDIPDNWTWIRLKSFSNIYNGNSINEEEKRKRYMGIDGYDFIATKDVNFDRTICYNNGVNIPYNTNFKIAPANKILMCIEGGSAGRKIAITNKNVCFGNKLACFDTFIVLDAYLFNILQSNEFLSIFKASLTGIIGGVSINTLKDFMIPLPPLNEQERIVEKINSCEPLIVNYSIAEEKLSKLEEEFPEKLKKSILQYAIEGKLVKQDTNDEPASVLLERIKAEKEKLIKEGKIKRDKNESYIYQGDDKNYYENLPESYVVTYLSFAGNWRSGATPQRQNPEYYGGTIPWIKTGELNNSIIYDSIEKITNQALEKCSLPINEIGNVLIAMYGATIGKLGIAGIPLTTNQACCGCKPFTDINNKYLFYYLMANKQHFIESAEGGAQPNISREKIITYPFILPPYRIQTIVSKKLDFILTQIVD